MGASCVNQLLGGHGAILVVSRSEIGWPKSVVTSLAGFAGARRPPVPASWTGTDPGNALREISRSAL